MTTTPYGASHLTAASKSAQPLALSCGGLSYERKKPTRRAGAVPWVRAASFSMAEIDDVQVFGTPATATAPGAGVASTSFSAARTTTSPGLPPASGWGALMRRRVV